MSDDFELDDFDFGTGSDSFTTNDLNEPEVSGGIEQVPVEQVKMNQVQPEQVKMKQTQSRPTPQGQRVNPHGRPPQGQSRQGQVGQGQVGQGQGEQGQGGQPRPNPNGQPNRPKQQRPQNSNIQASPPQTKPKKVKERNKKSFLPLILLPLLAVIMAGIAIVTNKDIPTAQKENYEQTGRFVYDSLLSALHTYDATKIDSLVGTSTGDSYLAQEWAYANNIKERQEFIKTICENVSFTYPQVEQLDTKGRPMKDVSGNPILVDSSMNASEAVTVTHVDYVALASTMQEDKDYILELYNSWGITEDDYDYNDEMVDLMLEYINTRPKLPLTTTDIALEVSGGVFTDDSALDNLLFASDDFHNMCDIFAQVVTGFTGFETEKYYVQEEQYNPEYTAWKMRFDAYYEADGGKFKKGVSKWEPWYLRDDDNNYILDENGNLIVNYYTVKDENGNDWVQPSEIIIVDVEKERQVEVEWDYGGVIPYCFIGAYYCQNDYRGNFSPEIRVGDGSLEFPAGVGTPIITKCLGTDGKYHDVKVTMIGYWVGEDAIDYAVSFSEKNRGFDISSVIQLICYEIKIENLEKEEFTFNSEMFLADKNTNKSARTGTMYGFKSTETLAPKGTVIINDWATSTELAHKFVCWGSSFNREYSAVYFKVLAGEGNTPTYSAYKAFTGESQLGN